MVGIVPAAGEGTRLRPFTFTLPKQLIPLLGKAIIEYSLGHLRGIGLRDEDIVVVVGYLGRLIQEYLSEKGYRVKYAVQEKRLGISHAIHVAIEQHGLRERDTPLIVYLADNILLEDLGEIHRRFIEGDYDAYVLLTPVPDPTRFGVAVVREGRIVKLVEKPKEPPSNLALVGVYFFRSAAEFERFFARLKPSWRGEYEITDLIQEYINAGRKVGFSIVSKWWKDIGTPEGLIDAMEMLLDAIDRPVIRGRVEGSVASSKVVVEEGAVVEGDIHGPAYIGRGSLLARNARILGYVSLEAGTIVKSGTLATTLVLGEGTVIDIDDAELVDSIVGRACNIRIHGVAERLRLLVGDKAVISVG